MAITSTIYVVQYAGNNSIVTPYQIPFQFMDTTDMVVETLVSGGEDPEDRVTLDLSAYTVTQLTNRTGSLVTDAAVPLTSAVFIRRATPLLQETDYVEGGPFPAQSMEDALDRLTMIAQEISGGNGGGTIVQPEALRDVVRWEASTDRGGVVPFRRGQIGVQMEDATLWMANSTAAGDWTAIAGGGGGGGLAVRVFANSTARTGATPAGIGQLGIQLDSVVLYSAASVTIGDWTPISQANTVAVWADSAARAAVDPLYIGQLGVQLSDRSLWISDDLAPGDWAVFSIAANDSAEAAGIAIWTDDAARAAKVPDFINQLGIQTTGRTMWLSSGTSAGNWVAFAIGGNAAGSPSLVISGTVIDWTLARWRFKSLSANDAFTFTNEADGICLVLDLTANGFTPTWPGGLVVDWDDTARNVVTLININGVITSSTVSR